MLRYLSTMLDSFFPHECTFPLQIAGCPHESIETKEQLLAHMQRSFILFTYRTGFDGIQTTTSVIRSDQGWGCLLRTSQMLLAHFLKLHVMPESTNGSTAASTAAIGAILRLFFDQRTDSAPFSLHNMIASVWDRKAFRAEYWSPSQGCEAIRRTVEQAVASGALPVPVAVVCSSNGCLVAEDVTLALRGDAQAVLLLAPVRVSVASQLTQEAYLQLEDIMTHPSCLGVVGGVPGRSYYFFGHSQTQLLYLDPHLHTQPALTSTRPDLRGVVVPRLEDVRCVDWSRVDTSLYLAFGLRAVPDWTSLEARLRKVRFLSIEQRRSFSDYEMQREQRHRAKAFMSPLHSSGVGIRKRPSPLVGPEDSVMMLLPSSAAAASRRREGSVVHRRASTPTTEADGSGQDGEGSGEDSWERLSDLEDSHRRGGCA